LFIIDVSLFAESRDSYEIKQQDIDELMKTLEREKTRKEELQWHRELMADEYSRVLKVAETFQEKFKFVQIVVMVKNCGVDFSLIIEKYNIT